MLDKFDYKTRYVLYFIVSIFMGIAGLSIGSFWEALMKGMSPRMAELSGWVEARSLWRVNSVFAGIGLFMVGLDLGYREVTKKRHLVNEIEFPVTETAKFSKYPGLFAMVGSVMCFAYTILYFVYAYLNFAFIFDCSRSYSSYTYRYRSDIDNLLRLFERYPEYLFWFIYSFVLVAGGAILLEQGVRLIRKGFKMRKNLSEYECVNILVIGIIAVAAGSLPTAILGALPTRWEYRTLSFPPRWFSTDLRGSVPVADMMGLPGSLAGLVAICGAVLGLWVLGHISKKKREAL